MNYLAIIADMVGSRQANDRRDVQKKLVGILDQLNREGDKRLASPFTVTLGDEFQALYAQAAGLFYDLWRISAALHPVKVRYSIAIGELATPVNPQQALGMDGPAFHLARDGIEAAREQEALFRVSGAVPQLNLINSSLLLISHMAKDWNANRYAVHAELSAGTPPKAIAKRVGISESAVYKNIDTAALQTVNAITQGIEAALDEAIGP